jgi:hypothetical protein
VLHRQCSRYHSNPFLPASRFHLCLAVYDTLQVHRHQLPLLPRVTAKTRPTVGLISILAAVQAQAAAHATAHHRPGRVRQVAGVAFKQPLLAWVHVTVAEVPIIVCDRAVNAVIDGKAGSLLASKMPGARLEVPNLR